MTINKDGWENRELHRLADEHGQQDDADGNGNAQRNCKIDHKSRQRNKQHTDKDHQAERHDDIFGAQQFFKNW